MFMTSTMEDREGPRGPFQVVNKKMTNNRFNAMLLNTLFNFLNIKASGYSSTTYFLSTYFSMGFLPFKTSSISSSTKPLLANSIRNLFSRR